MDRKSPVRLEDDEKYAVYKYVIENHCVIQNGETFSFRVQPSQIANEMNILGLIRIINQHHVKEAVDKVISWQKRLNKIPVVPKETVEVDMLKVENAKKTRELVEAQTALENCKKMLEAQKQRASRAYAILGGN